MGGYCEICSNEEVMVEIVNGRSPRRDDGVAITHPGLASQARWSKVSSAQPSLRSALLHVA